MVSVVMSVYKESERWINNSITSVLRQTYSNIELLIVDDNPQDAIIRNILEERRRNDNRIKLIYNENNIGLTKSLNKAFRLMKGEYFARIDADDCWKPEKIQLQIRYLETHPEVTVCGTWIDLIDESDEVIGRYRYPETDYKIGCQMLTSNPIIHSSVLIRMESLQDRDKIYNESYKTAQDYALWTSLYLEGCQFANLSNRLVLYRCSDSQITKTKKQEQKSNASLIAKAFRDEVFAKSGVADYERMKSEELSKALLKASGEKRVTRLCYHYLYQSYKKEFGKSSKLLVQLLVSGDIFRYSFCDVLRLFR